MTVEELRTKGPHAARFFDRVMNEGGRKNAPWKPIMEPALHEFYESPNNDDSYNIGSYLETGVYELLWMKFRHTEFNKLCEQIHIKDGIRFDAWGPYESPTFKQFFAGLSIIEKKEFMDYLEKRKQETINIETEGQFFDRALNYTLLGILLETAEDDYQRCRFLASIVDYVGNYDRYFTEDQLMEIKLRYATYLKVLKKATAIRPPLNAITPIEWKGKKADLVWIMDCLKAIGYISSTDREVVDHFSFPSKDLAADPIKRFRDTRHDIRRQQGQFDSDRMKQFIQTLQLSPDELQQQLQVKPKQTQSKKKVIRPAG